MTLYPVIRTGFVNLDLPRRDYDETGWSTGWCDPELTYDDLRAAGCVAVDWPARQVKQ